MKKLAIVSHDAGGAEVLSSWLKEMDLEFNSRLEGPAIKIFNNKFRNLNSLKLSELIKNSDILICSASWESDIEKKAISLAKQFNKKTIVMFDHWINYEERLTHRNNLLIPDEIWVTDKYALLIAQQIFSKIIIKLKKNFYMNNEIKNILHLKMNKTNKNKILYICEPIENHAKKQCDNENAWGYNEKDAIKNFLHYIPSIKNNYSKVVFRPHPSENVEKYSWVKIYSQKGFEIDINNTDTLVSQISSSSLVVGCESMAMVIALLAKKIVLTSIPEFGRPCVLPHKGIIKIKDFFSLG